MRINPHIADDGDPFLTDLTKRQVRTERAGIRSRGGFDADLLSPRPECLEADWTELPDAMDPVERQRLRNAEKCGEVEIKRAPDGRLLGFRQVN